MRDALLNVGAASSGASDTTDPPPSGDTVVITKAEYKASKSELKVEATSSDQPNVTLTLVGYGTMTWKNNKYEFKGKGVADPGATVTVTSSGGGEDTKAVTQK
jgi:ABC-type sulfate transport system substrate-binding protein